MRILPGGINTIINSVSRRNIVGLRVRQARESAKPRITQLDLVARLQVLGLTIDQSALSKIENGQRPVSDIEVAALAESLRLPVQWLFQESDKCS
jgi:transcriptional regulator with XRE-family HTH domain